MRLFMPSIISAFFFSSTRGIEALGMDCGHRGHRSMLTRSDASNPRGVCSADPRDVEASAHGRGARGIPARLRAAMTSSTADGALRGYPLRAAAALCAAAANGQFSVGLPAAAGSARASASPALRGAFQAMTTTAAPAQRRCG
jgi:hypothetical protein